MGRQRNSSRLEVRSLCSTQLYHDLTTRMEQAFNATNDVATASEVMGVFGLVAAGLVDLYATRSGRTKDEEFEVFCSVVQQCMDSVTVIEQQVH